MMLIYLPYGTPKRQNLTWDQAWKGEDGGLISSWERGQELRLKNDPVVRLFENGELPIIAWKGGVEKKIKKSKFGSLHYLATRQGALGMDLNIDTDKDIVLTCSKTDVQVIYTSDLNKLNNES